jgi:GAF domain.
VLGEAAKGGEPIAIPDLADAADLLMRDVAVAAGFYSVLVVPLVDQKGILGSLVVLRKSAGEFSPALIGLDADLCAPVGAGDAQRAAVQR